MASLVAPLDEIRLDGVVVIIEDITARFELYDDDGVIFLTCYGELMIHWVDGLGVWRKNLITSIWLVLNLVRL